MKEYGKLSSDQLRVLVEAVPLLDRLRREAAPAVEALLRGGPAPASFAWLYELPLAAHLAIWATAAGVVDDIVKIASAPDEAPEKAIDLLRRESAELSGTDIKISDGLSDQDFWALSLTVIRSMDCLMLHQRYLNELVAEGANGNVPSLLKALRVDAGVLTCPSVTSRLALLNYGSDQKLQRQVANALRGPSKREAQYLRPVKLALQALHEAGAHRLSDEDLAELFVHHLRLIKEAPNSDPGKSLQKLQQRTRRKSTT